MSVATTLLKADHLGVRDLKEHLSVRILNRPLVITDRGVPISVNLPYSDALELMDLLDELEDPQTLAAISEGRKAINAGVKGIPVSHLFSRIRPKRK